MNLDRLLDNRTPMAVAPFDLEDRRGRDVVVVVAKMTWEIGPGGRVSIAPSGTPVEPADAWHGGPWSSLRRASDREPERPGTDILLVGAAHPEAAGATHQDVTLRVAASQKLFEKTLRVHGPRVWTRSAAGVAPGPAAELTPTPLIYENAFGGVDESDPDDVLRDERNPAGTGVARDRARLIGAPAFRIEDPRAPLTPCGFGPIAAGWQPRLGYAGTMDAAWIRDRAPVAPADRDPRFHCCAPEDQWSQAPLLGDEPVEVIGASAGGPLRFKLPRHDARFTSVIRGAERDEPAHLDTFLVDATARRVELTWRAAVRVPRRVDDLEQLRVHFEQPISDALWAELRDRLGIERISA